MTVSFCMIVFNEEVTLEANLEHLYPHAHEIIVCEGSVALLRESLGVPARSTDGTIDVLHRFPDPLGKLRILQEDWHDKNEMAAAYARHATGDLIWHVDADEFYDDRAFAAVQCEFEDARLTTLEVPMYVFWKSPAYVLVDAAGDDRWFRYARVLRREDGMSVRHIPVRRVIDGRVDANGLRGPSDRHICGWHYAWNIDARVRMKMELYGRRDAKTTRPDWLARVWDRWTPDSPVADFPNGVHPSCEWQLWPRPFVGHHPDSARGVLDRLALFSANTLESV